MDDDADGPVALLNIPPAQFKLFMDSTIWAIKHTMRDIADTGLNRKLLRLPWGYRLTKSV